MIHSMVEEFWSHVDNILLIPIQESYFHFSKTIQKNSFHNSMRFCVFAFKFHEYFVGVSIQHHILRTKC